MLIDVPVGPSVMIGLLVAMVAVGSLVALLVH
jgi:hypothetical protein